MKEKSEVEFFALLSIQVCSAKGKSHILTMVFWGAAP